MKGESVGIPQIRAVCLALRVRRCREKLIERTGQKHCRAVRKWALTKRSADSRATSKAMLAQQRKSWCDRRPRGAAASRSTRLVLAKPRHHRDGHRHLGCAWPG